MAHSNSSVTVDRDHFETLVRRANFNTDPTTSSNVVSSLPNPTVVLLRDEYDHLRLAARQYANLRRNLLRGGLEEQTIAVLCADDDSLFTAGNPCSQPAGTPPTNTEESSATFNRGAHDGHSHPGFASPKASVFLNHGAVHKKHMPSGGPGDGLSYAYNSVNGHGHGQGHSFSHIGQNGLRPGAVNRSHDSSNWHEADGLGDEDDAGDDMPPDSSRLRPAFYRNCQRTIQLANLPETATLADVAAVVHGGLLLDIYIRMRDRSAMVSFLREPDARDFFDYVRKHDLYVKNKRVDVRWSDRQFVLPGHIANKVSLGATRNLVIRRCDARITEEKIREDLNHIHNLAVLSVKFADGSCFINTNSVHNALFARTCMMSRAMYKGSKIEYMPDECAMPIEKTAPTVKPRRDPIAAKKPPVFVAPNRFQLLNLDGESGNESNEESRNEDDDDDDEDDEDSTDELHGGGGAFAAAFQTNGPVGIMV